MPCTHFTSAIISPKKKKEKNPEVPLQLILGKCALYFANVGRKTKDGIVCSMPHGPPRSVQRVCVCVYVYVCVLLLVCVGLLKLALLARLSLPCGYSSSN